METVPAAAERREENSVSTQPDPEMQRINEALRKPFAYKTYTVPPKGNRKARTYAYIDARDVENLLDAVVGMENWSDTYETFGPEAVQCHLTVLGVTKSGIGYPNSSRDDEEEPLKAAESDALKRAAVKFGIGRFLYTLKIANPSEAQSDNGQFSEPPLSNEEAAQFTTPVREYGTVRKATDNQISAIAKMSKRLDLPFDMEGTEALSMNGASERIKELGRRLDAQKAGGGQ